MTLPRPGPPLGTHVQGREGRTPGRSCTPTTLSPIPAPTVRPCRVPPLFSTLSSATKLYFTCPCTLGLLSASSETQCTRHRRDLLLAGAKELVDDGLQAPLPVGPQLASSRGSALPGLTARRPSSPLPFSVPLSRGSTGPPPSCWGRRVKRREMGPQSSGFSGWEAGAVRPVC